MENKIVPTTGRIVMYNTTEAERNALQLLGCNKQTQLPAVIVAVWGDTPNASVNLKVFVDGNHLDLWKTSVPAGVKDAEGKYNEYSWSWPERN